MSLFFGAFFCPFTSLTSENDFHALISYMLFKLFDGPKEFFRATIQNTRYTWSLTLFRMSKSLVVEVNFVTIWTINLYFCDFPQVVWMDLSHRLVLLLARRVWT